MAGRLRVLTAQRMRAADGRAVRAGTPVETLMERAGQGAVRAIEKHLGGQRGYRVRLVCGKGNNGGDGFVVARLLAGLGARVEVILLADPAALGGAARANWERLPGAGVVTRCAPDEAALGEALGRLARADLVVDGLLGTGASGPLSPAYERAVAAIAEERARGGARVVALDLPTGLDADGGRPQPARSGGGPGPCVRADLTVTFAHAKPAHVLYPGRELCGAIEIVDIGVEPDDADGGPAPVIASEPDMAALLPRRGPTAHKGQSGRVLVVGGSAGLTGAVVMASMSALRAGAGLVTAAVPASVNDAIEAAMIEAMTWPLAESEERALAAAVAPAVLARAAGVQCVALGPGLSQAAGARALARDVVEGATVPVVLDADGLNAFAGAAARFARRTGGAPLIVTPHLGEMSRLTGRAIDELEADRLAAPARHAAEWNAVVVMKGAPTVVAAPDGRVMVNPTGNPGMASAGMGDVLTGVLAGFVAQGMAPFDAACLAVYVHGLAADVARTRVGTLSLVAGDVTAALPQVLHRLEAAGSRSEPVPVPFPQARIAPASPDPSRSAPA